MHLEDLDLELSWKEWEVVEGCLGCEDDEFAEATRRRCWEHGGLGSSRYLSEEGECSVGRNLRIRLQGLGNDLLESQYLLI